MKISFLVTYFNQERFVRQSLDSILAINKPEDWEILVGDDGSSDNTVETVNEYIGKYPDRIRLYIMPREKGVEYDHVRRASANRINLLAHATGDCFCTLDGDDFYYDKAFVNEAIEVFERYPDVSLVMFGYRYYRDGKFGEEQLLPIDRSQFVDKECYIRNWYLHAGAGVHRILWGDDRINHIKSIGFFDDNDIVINSLNYGNMYYINRVVYAYRQTGDSLYTSMQEIEQAVLNVQGYDVDRKLINNSYNESLIIRNAGSFLTMYFNRYKLRQMLGEDNYTKYYKSCSEIDEAVSFELLRYSKQNHIDSKQIRQAIDLIRKNRRTLFYKYKIKSILKRVK